MSVHTLAASPTACYLEHMPWGLSLFQESLHMVDGQVLVPNRPGLGLTWDEAAIRPLLVD
jgi:mandelate racemase